MILRMIAKAAHSKSKTLDQTFFAAVFAYGLIDIFGFKSVILLWRIYARFRSAQKGTMRRV